MGPNIYYAPDTGTDGADTGAEPVVSTPVDGSSASEGNLNRTPAWMAQLPNELKSDESLAKYSTLGDAIKGLMENKGAEANKTETPTPAKYENFDKKLATGYDPFGDIGDGMKNYFETKGVNQKDAEEFFDAFEKTYENAYQNMISKGKTMCEEAAKIKWGNEYETKRALMAKGYQALGDTDGSLQELLDKSGGSLNIAVWEVLSRVGSLVSEDSVTSAKGSGGGNTPNSGCPIDYSKPSV